MGKNLTKLANILAGFLADYSRRAKIRHATSIRTKPYDSFDLMMNLYSRYPKLIIAMSRHTNKNIFSTTNMGNERLLRLVKG